MYIYYQRFPSITGDHVVSEDSFSSRGTDENYLVCFINKARGFPRHALQFNSGFYARG